jgi:serine/threonine-protein kinase RsbW
MATRHPGTLVSIPKRLSLSESYPAVAGTVPRARAAVAEFAQVVGATEPELEAIRLAVTEAVTNVVVHAYGEAGGQVHLTAALASDELWVLVADDGRGFLHASRGANRMGWGLALIADTCERFEIAERAGGGTELRMCFRLSAALPA